MANFSELFSLTLISQSIETFCYLVGALIFPFDTFLTMGIYSPMFEGNLIGETMLLFFYSVPVKPGDDKPKRRLTDAEKSKFTLSENLKEVIVGSLLGDMSAQKDEKSQNARLRFGQGFVNKEYLFHLYDLFKPYCTSKPVVSILPTHKVTGIEYLCVSFNTLSFGCFTELYDLFYNSGKKVVPQIIGELLTPIGLAY